MQSAQAIITLLRVIPPFERRKVIEWIDIHREDIETDDSEINFMEAVASDTLAGVWNTNENDIWDSFYTETK